MENSCHVTPSRMATASPPLRPPTRTVRQRRHGTRAPISTPASTAATRAAARRCGRGRRRPFSASCRTATSGRARPTRLCTDDVSNDSTVALSRSGAAWVAKETVPTGGTLTSLPPPSDQEAWTETSPGPTRPEAPANGSTATATATAATMVAPQRPMVANRPCTPTPPALRRWASQPTVRAHLVTGRKRDARDPRGRRRGVLSQLQTSPAAGTVSSLRYWSATMSSQSFCFHGGVLVATTVTSAPSSRRWPCSSCSRWA